MYQELSIHPLQTSIHQIANLQEEHSNGSGHAKSGHAADTGQGGGRLGDGLRGGSGALGRAANDGVDAGGSHAADGGGCHSRLGLAVDVHGDGYHGDDARGCRRDGG